MPVDRPPPPNRTSTLPYLDLPWEEFEELSRAVLACQPGIDPLETELFEVPGKAQYGIDSLALRRDGTWVAQSCKREKRATPGQLIGWSNDFLDHWETRWSKYPIREFILSVAAQVRGEGSRQEIQSQRQRFDALGIKYIVWNARGLDGLLRTEPDIVGRHFPGWVERHCGVGAPPPPTARHDTRIIAFERNVSEDLERLVAARNAGATLEARRLIDRLGRAAEYGQLDETGKRTFRRIAVTEAFDAEGLDGALAARARHPGDVGDDVGALLTMERDGPEAALAELDGRNAAFPAIRAQILIACERFGEAEAILSSPGDATEMALRAKALAALGRHDEALAVQKHAEEADPDNAAIAKIGLGVRYAHCVAPSGVCEAAWPEPLPDELYRRDAETLAVVRSGAGIAAAKAAAPGQSDADRGEWLTWRLAFLCCDPDASEAAAACARDIVDAGNAHPGIVTWSLWCGLDIDRKGATRDLDRVHRNGDGGLDHLTALLFLLETGGEMEKARNVLAAAGTRFGGHRLFEVVRSVWRRRLDPSAISDEFPAALQGAVRDGDWAALVRVAASSPRGTLEGARRTVLAARAMERFGRFDELLLLVPQLVEDVGTDDALEMAAQAHLAAGEWDAVAALLAGGGVEPDPVARPRAADMLAEARSRSGDVAGALRLRMGLRGTVADPHGMGLIRSFLDLGDVASAAATAAHVTLESLRPHEAVSAISVARLANPAAARSLAERALAVPALRDHVLPALLPLGHVLGIEERLGPLVVDAIAGDRLSGSRMSADELPRLMEERRRHAEELNRLWRRGALPVALFAPGVNLDTAELVLGGSSVGPSPMLLAQHASRPAPGEAPPEGSVPLPPRPSRLVLDYPAFLLAHRLGMVGDLHRTFGSLAVPRGLPVVLAEATARAEDVRSAMRSAHERIAEAVRSGSVVVTDEAPGLLVGETDEGASATLDGLLAFLAAGGGDGAATPPGFEAETLGFAGMPVEALAVSGGWHRALERYAVFVRPEEMARIGRAGEAIDLDVRRGRSLRAMTADLSDGFGSGRYEILPSLPASDERNPPPTSADEAVLDALFQSRFPVDAALFSGDRCLNGFAALETIPVVGVANVVEWLAEGGLPERRVRTLRHVLREANVRFAHCPAGDIERELFRSPVRDGRVRETAELAAMRRQISRDLLMDADWRLDGSSGIAGQGLEWEAARHFAIEATRVLRHVWSDGEADPATRTARADYLLAMFVTDRTDRLPLGDDAGAKARWVGMAAGRLYEAAFTAGLHGVGRAAEVVDWIGSRLHGRWTRDGSAYRDAAGEALAILVGIIADEEGLSEVLDGSLLAAYRQRIADVFSLLPEWLQNRVVDRTDIPGIVRYPHVWLGPHRVRLESFETALATAAGDGADFIDVTSEDGERRATLGRCGVAEGEAEIVLDGTRIRLANLRLALVMSVAVGRTAPPPAAARTMREPERRRFAERLRAGCRTLAAADGIIDGFHALRMADAEARFTGDSLPANCLHPPAPAVLAAHLAWEPGMLADSAAFPGASERVARDASAPLDAPYILGMLHLPTPLPDRVRAAVADLTEADRRALLDELAELAPSVLPRAHLRRLAHDTGCDCAAIAVPTLNECSALGTLFRWVWRLTGTRAEWRTVSASARLILSWFHASQLADLLVRCGQPPDRVPGIVDGWNPTGIEEALLPAHDAFGQMAGPDIEDKALYLSLYALAVPEPSAGEVEGLLEVARAAPPPAGSAFTHPDPFLAETLTMPDDIGSVFGAFRTAPPGWLLEFGPWFDPAEMDASVRTNLPWNTDEPMHAGNWCTYLHLRRRGLPEAEASDLVAALASHDFAGALADDPNWAAALPLLVAMKDRLPEPGRELLADALNRMATERSDQADAEQWMEHVLRFLRSLPGDRQMDRFAADLTRMMPAMLASPDVWCGLLTRLARHVGPDVSGGIWNAVLELRAT